MPTHRINGIDIVYDTFGQPHGRPLVLIMGLATSMVAWPEQFCRMLAETGHFVVRFDNRDAGLSSKLEHLGVPDLERIMADIREGKKAQVPYTLSDMAADTLGLMDAMEIERVHVLGVSMGGMIGQIMAITHPQRMASLISMMSTTSEPGLPPSTPAAMKAMMDMPPNSREGYQEYLLGMMLAFSDESDLLDEDLQRQLAGQAFERGLHPNGFFRQMAAIMAAGGRRRQLQQVRVPTLVIHGDRDTVLPPAHGRDTAEAVPGARMLEVPGLGHALAFPGLWPQIVAAVSAHTAEAGAGKILHPGTA